MYLDGGSLGYYVPLPSEFNESAALNKSQYTTSGKYDGYCSKDWEGWFLNITGGYNIGTLTGGSSTTSAQCPSGYNYDSTGKCYANPTCSYGGVFDGSNDKCYLPYSKTCSIGTYDSVIDKCVIDADCNEGTLNTTRDKCELSREIVCPVDTKKDLKTGKCAFNSTCLNGGTLDTVTKRCLDDKIPLDCIDSTADTSFDVCFSHVDECAVDSSFVNASTLAYSDALQSCLVEEDVVCASTLTWSDTVMKCEAVPICYEGIYNPKNDFCYIGDQPCPISPDLACNGEINNKWCSPYNCNPKTNQCGYAKCYASTGVSTKEEPPEILFGLIQLSSDSVCQNLTCYISDITRFSYCGSDTACPQGFGVFLRDGKCYKKVCPSGSEQIGGNCYIQQ